MQGVSRRHLCLPLPSNLRISLPQTEIGVLSFYSSAKSAEQKRSTFVATVAANLLYLRM